MCARNCFDLLVSISRTQRMAVYFFEGDFASQFQTQHNHARNYYDFVSITAQRFNISGTKESLLQKNRMSHPLSRTLVGKRFCRS